MSTTTSLRTPTAVLALAAAALAVVALVVAVVALQGSTKTAAPAPAPESPCKEPITVAANHGLTYAGDLGQAVAAVRLAYPDRAVEVLPPSTYEEAGSDLDEADVVVNTVRHVNPPTAPSPGAVSLQHEGQVWVQLSPFDDFGPTVEEIAGAVLLAIPACDAGEDAAR